MSALTISDQGYRKICYGCLNSFPKESVVRIKNWNRWFNYCEECSKKRLEKKDDSLEESKLLISPGPQDGAVESGPFSTQRVLSDEAGSIFMNEDISPCLARPHLTKRCVCCRRKIQGVIMGKRQYCNNCRSYISNIRAKLRIEFNKKLSEVKDDT